jgi:hypothetical protein
VLDRRELLRYTAVGAVTLGSAGLSGTMGTSAADTIQLPFGNGAGGKPVLVTSDAISG